MYILKFVWTVEGIEHLVGWGFLALFFIAWLIALKVQDWKAKRREKKRRQQHDQG